MIITSATPQELVYWFHVKQDKQRVLCVMLAPAQEDQKKLVSLIGDLFNADATLGKEIAFLLLHPKANKPLGLDKGYGEFATIPGCAFPSNGHRGPAYSLRDAEIFRDMSDEFEFHRKDIAIQSAKSTASFVPEFMELFGVSQSELPALCVLVKGVDDSIVLPLGNDWTTGSLLKLLGEIRSLAEKLPNFRSEYQTLANEVPAKLRVLSDSTREIQAKITKIVEILERLVGRYSGTEVDRTAIADFVARDCPSSPQLQELLTTLSFSSVSRYLKDGQVAKVMKLMMRIENLRDELQNDLESRAYVLSITERAQQLTEGREKLFQELASIQNVRLKNTSSETSRLLSRIRSGLEGINLAGDLGEKLLNAMEWVRKLVTP